MARPLRLEFPGAVYHITSRGNERGSIYSNDEDRQTFLDILCKAVARYNWLLHAYCLMGNHYHLLVETPDGNLSRGMRQLNGEYTQQYNRRHRRSGHLFEGRYKSILVDKEAYLLALCRYVVLNPVRAGLVRTPEQWKWSSYSATTGTGRAIECLSVDWVLGQFARRRADAVKRYRDFVREGAGREGPWDEVEGQIVLGGLAFIKRIMRMVKQSDELSEVPRVQRHVGRLSLDEIFKRTGPRVKEARDRSICEAYYAGYGMREIAEHLSLHYTTVSVILKKMEKKSKTL